MSTTSQSSGFERPEVIRVLVESRTLPRKAAKALSLTNKTVFRLLFQEKKRFKIKNLTFFKDRRSPLWTAIDADLPENLAQALELGEFDTDTASPIGRVFHANNGRGIQLLLGLCIKKGAARCFNFLLEWVDDPATPFNYNRMWLYMTAKLVAQDEGRLECLLHLLDSDKEGFFPSPNALYLALMRQVRTPVAVGWLSRRLPPDTDYLHTLVAQCSVKYMQPALLEAFIDLIPRSRLSDVVPSAWKNGVNPTALSAAASALHLPAIDLLIRRGARVFPPTSTDPDASTPNPIAAALSHPFPRLNSPSPRSVPINNTTQTNKTSATNPPTPSNLETLQWHNKTQHHAAAMRTTLLLLLDKARFETRFDDSHHPPDTLPTALNAAALTYIHTLRAFLLSNLSLLISMHPQGRTPKAAAEFRAGLVTPAPAGRRTVWSSTAPRYELDGAEGADETSLPCTWRPHLTVKHGKWLRGRLLDLDERQQLIQPGAAGLVPVLEAVWGMVAAGSVGECAAKCLKVGAVREEGEYEGGWETRAGLWELLVAGERVVVREEKREKGWFREVKRWSMREEDTSSEEEDEEGGNTEVQNSDSVTDASKGEEVVVEEDASEM